MLKRTLDPTFLNDVANHPEVRAAFAGADALDLADIIGNPSNITLAGAHGGFVVHNQGGGIYECHSLFLPTGRGPAVVTSALEAFRYVFSRTDCVEVVTRVPAHNVAALALTKRVGFVHKFDRAGAWQGPVGASDVSYWGFSLDHWAMSDEALEAGGKWFHDQLEAAKIAAGSALVVHGHDLAHERAVGAAVAMIRGGNPQKAIWFYNRWARLAGYADIRLIDMHPIIVDVVDAVVALAGDEMEVLLCR